ncbi:hypothetical protein FEM48_Zijuj11G0075300 [Ziziphus jujuba var. spinosa]|uniref:Disease resistance R13L4/SHOC-2-like LRR domain-containing protein n=1 Tax=Ziziphus jujuba var. spinosa TaxID=714518 RepID=A0A978UHM8_ZIZJJ|nr:hypothetical protein FEM48_Zijuj11G0075300 [Ziziphus jujuba var. spinosa]
MNSLVYLDLSSNTFIGPFPNSAYCWNLTSLKGLNAADNSMDSSLSIWISGLSSSLESLDLGGNALQGPLPCSNQNLTALRYLDLSGCELNSTAAISIGFLYDLVGLEYLYLRDSNLEGVISSAIQNLTSLVHLELSSNSLIGEMPTCMGNLASLVYLDLSSNSLEGEIPSFLGNLTSIVHLDLSFNSLKAKIPTALGNLKSIVKLDLSTLGNLKSIVKLDLSSNSIQGEIPTSLGNLCNLSDLSLGGNKFGGKVSNAFDSLLSAGCLSNSLTSLDLSENLFFGQLTDQIAEFKNVVRLSLGDNMISGPLPESLGKLTEIPDILHIDSPYSMVYMSSNMLSGPLPRITSGLVELDLSNNSLSGDISHFLCHPLATPNNLSILHLGRNHFSGNIPDCWMHWPELEVINLDDNNLTGKIPSSVESLQSLLSLHLRNNSLSGEITPSLQNCKQLSVLDVGLNEFSGSIPTWMGTRLNLTVLILRSNKLNGQIPFELCSLTALQIMDVADNNLSGTIPRCFDKLKAMTTEQVMKEAISYSNFGGYFFEEVMVVIKGREDQYDIILPLVNGLDLSSNKLTGEIPQQLTALQGLISLNLSENFLEGRIPDSIGNMKSLESLDFSRNQLSGVIPPSLSSLTFLSYLNLSYNNLSGKIPLSTQIQSFDASSFIGNALCGPPLYNICDEDQSKPTINNEEQKADDGGEADRWFHLGIGTGFAVGFFGVVAPLLISTDWRHAYFGFFGYFWYKILYKYNCLWP